jgi:patatin-like phospholipase/acyl hydrolase
MKRILSVDGGGIRGIVPCACLVELERQTGKLTRDLFDFVAGTSTGALLAAAVAVGIPASDILTIYTERSKEIFTGAWPDARMFQRGYRFDTANIAKVLRSVFGARADWTLNDCPIRVLITAVGVNRHPWYFVRDTAQNAGTTGKLSLVDCATASAAAPTYFAPWYVSPLSGSLVGWCFDGGTGVTGNPVYQACVEAFEFDDFSATDTRVVSLGTGYFPTTAVNPPSGFLDTLSWTVDTLLASPHSQQTEIVNRHYPGILSRHDWVLPKPIDMGDIASIPALLEVGRAAANSMDWKSLV